MRTLARRCIGSRPSIAWDSRKNRAKKLAAGPIKDGRPQLTGFNVAVTKRSRYFP